MTDAQPHPPPGLLAGRYELGAALGRGRSTVYRAIDTRLRREVAVKQVDLLAGQEDADRARTRALREAQAAARLNNSRVVIVYDVVEEAGAIWLVMELVEAPSLAQVVEEAPLTHERAAQVGLDVLTALEAAHLVGIVHRDAKPANVLVQAGDRAKLTDFGVATIRDESRLTATGLIVGSPSYMAPEQARGAEVGPPADLWALGAMLYFATEGAPPFLGDSALATAWAVVNADPRPPRRPGALTGLISRLLTKDPAGRPTAGETRATLTRVARRERSRLARAAPAPATPGVTLPVPAAEPGGAEPGAAEPAAAEPPTVKAPVTLPDPAAEAPTVQAEADDLPSGTPGATAAPIPAPAPVDGTPPPATLAGEAPHATEGTPADVPAPAPAGEPAHVSGGAPPAAPAPALAPHPAVAAPRREYRRPERPRSGLAVLAVVALALLVVAAAVAALRSGGGSPSGETGKGPGARAPATTGARGAGTTAAPTTTAAAGSGTSTGLPPGWTAYHDDAAGYTIGYPPGWRVVRAGGPRIDFRDPRTGAYLRVDWTATPGSDPAADWRRQAVGYARRHPGYEEIGIAPTTYRDYNAALWEFRYGANPRLHVANLGFVTGGKGYALLFQAPEGDWAARQGLLRQFRQSFRPG